MSDGPEAYPDLLSDFYRSHESNVAIYRLAAPNITYMEALWYLVYLTENRVLEPDMLVLQLHYETFRKTGIRNGMINMLDDEKFSSAAEKIASRYRPYSNLFLRALQKRREQMAKNGKAAGNEAIGEDMHTGIAESANFGNWIETDFRNGLDRVPGFSRWLQMKGRIRGPAVPGASVHPAHQTDNTVQLERSHVDVEPRRCGCVASRATVGSTNCRSIRQRGFSASSSGAVCLRATAFSGVQ